MGENFRLAAVIAQIAARQHGNVSRAQLRGVGMSDQGIRRRVDRGYLHLVYRSVYSVGHPPVEPLDKAAAAVLACGPRAALSHASAMTLWGFWKRWDEPFDVTVAADRRPRGIHTHRCATLLQRDIVLRERIRVTTAARTLLDMAPRIPAKSLTRFINDGRLSKVLTPDDLSDVATRNPTHPGARLLISHASITQNATRSGGEDDFQVFCRHYGFQEPLINTSVHGFEVDAYFPYAKLAVELDGWDYHSSRQSFEENRDRDATLLMYGIATIRITYARMRVNPDREAARLHTILEDRRRQLHG